MWLHHFYLSSMKERTHLKDLNLLICKELFQQIDGNWVDNEAALYPTRSRTSTILFYFTLVANAFLAFTELTYLKSLLLSVCCEQIYLRVCIFTFRAYTWRQRYVCVFRQSCTTHASQEKQARSNLILQISRNDHEVFHHESRSDLLFALFWWRKEMNNCCKKCRCNFKASF